MLIHFNVTMHFGEVSCFSDHIFFYVVKDSLEDFICFISNYDLPSDSHYGGFLQNVTRVLVVSTTYVTLGQEFLKHMTLLLVGD